MSRPRLLDLFAGAGGAAMGYHRAGFDVVGVDINPQPRYPFEFKQMDAMDTLRGASQMVTNFGTSGLDFDAIHASPPCQAYSVTRHSHGKTHPELVEPVRELLQEIGLPWVMENVPGAPMTNYVELCGASFELEATDDDGAPLVLRRHRLFETSFMVWSPPPCECARYRNAGVMVGGVYGAGPSNRSKSPWKGSDRRRGGYTPKQHVRAELMGIEWMTQAELSQAIPPAYTEWVGRQLLGVLDG